MATTTRRRPGRTLLVLGILVILLAGGLLAGTRWGGATLAPKLALDLEGGTQIILTPVTEGDEQVTEDTIAQAIEIIRQRVDASGVAEAEITSQGGRNIVVALPGRPSEETLDLVRESARLLFRPVLAVSNPGPVDPEAAAGGGAGGLPEGPLAPEDDATVEDGTTEDGGTGDDTTDDGATSDEDATSGDGATSDGDAATDGTDDNAAGLADVDTDGLALTSAKVSAGTTDDAESPAATEEPAATTETTDSTETSDPSTETTEPTEPAEAPEPENASDLAWLTDDVLEEFYARDCTDPENLRGGAELEGDPALPVVACDVNGLAKYVLGPVEVFGEDVASATSGLRTTPSGAVTNVHVVNIDFDSQGTTKFREVTRRLTTLEPPRDAFAIVLDGLVISAPQVNVIINDGNAEISGSFDQESAATLAQQLNFGSLPLSFEVQSEQQLSATLGSEQLSNGLLAGVIGLALVGLWSLFQYRALGLVTITSLVIAGVLTYLAIAYLSWIQGYRLSLAGVAGIIVAIGITADSFIVYFERIRDELRDGRSLVAAVDEAWPRARRTILASDAVSFLAAVVLYFLAVGGVRGFAFTLGLTTLIDLLVVLFFTHPVMELLARTRFFGQGHRLSGLDPSVLRAHGSRYVGRGRVAGPGERASRTTGNPPGDDGGPGKGPEADPAVPAVPAPVPDSREASAAAGGQRLTIAERRALREREAREAGGSDADTGVDGPDEGKDA